MGSTSLQMCVCHQKATYLKAGGALHSTERHEGFIEQASAMFSMVISSSAPAVQWDVVLLPLYLRS